MSVFDNVTADRVKALRESSGEGMMACKHTLEKAAVLATLGEMDVEGTIDPRLSEILEWLVERRGP